MEICPTCSFENPPGIDRCQKCRTLLEVGKSNPVALEGQIRVLLAQGQKIEAIKAYREATGASLAEAKDAVEAMNAGPGLPPTAMPDHEQEILELLHQGKKIAAIKLHRERTGKGLKEAKDAVEALATRHGIAKGGGCVGVIAIVLMIGALVAVLVR